MVYLTGHPVYSAEKMQISVKNIKYDVNTESTLLNAAAWMLSPVVLSKIENILVFDASNDMLKIKNITDNYLKEIKIKNIGALQGSLNSLSVDKVVVQRDAIQVLVKASGKMQMKLSDLNP